MPKNAAIIGRVAVKVLPDTSEFRADAQRELDAIESELKPIEVQINPKIDLEQIVSEVNRARDVAQAAMRDITLHVNVDTRNFGNGLNDVNNQLGNFDHVRTITIDGGTSDIKVQVDQTSKAHALLELAQLQREIQDITCHINVDVDSVSREKALADLKTLNEEIRNVDTEIKVNVDGPSKIKAAAELDVLTHPRDVSIRPDLDQGAMAKVLLGIGMLSGGRVYAMKMEGVAELAGSLDVLVPKVAAASLGIAGLAAVALASTGSILSLAGNIAVMSGAALALPGILGGMAVGLGASVIALKDFKKEIPEVTSLWASMKSAISDNFWSTAKSGMSEMVDTLMPKMTTQLAGTSKYLGGFFGQLSSDITKALGPRLPGMFDNLNASIAVASTSTGGLANIFGILGTTGARWLPRLSGFFADTTNKLSDWLTKQDQMGFLDGYIQAGVMALKDMGGVLKESGRIFMGLTQAAAAGGGATLATLHAGLKNVADTINSPEFQKSLTGTFQAAHDAIHNLTSTAGPAFKDMFLVMSTTLQTILPMVGTAIGSLVSGLSTALSSPVLQQGLVSMFEGIGQAVIALSPAFTFLGQALGIIAPLFGQMAQVLAPIFAGAMESLVPIMNALVPVISQLITIFGGAFQQVMVAIEPIIVMVVQAFSDFLTYGGLAAIGLMVSALVPVIKTLAGAFGTIFSSIMEVAAPVLSSLAQAFAGILTAIGPVINSLVSTLLPVLPVIAQAFMAIVNAIAPLIPILITALAPIIPIIADTLAQIAGVIAPIVKALAGSLAPVLPVIADAFIQLVSALAPVIPMLVGALAPILPMIAKLIGQIAVAIAPLLPALVKLLMAVIMPLVPLFLQLVQSVLLPLAPIISNLVSSLLPFINALTEVAQVLLPILVPILTMLADVLIGAVMGAINGVVNMFTGFLDILTGLWEIVSGIFSGNWSKVWQGIKDVFQGVFEFIGGLVEFVWNVIILATFMDGVGFLKDLWGGLWGFIKSIFEDSWNAVFGLIKDVWVGIKGGFSEGVDAIKYLWETVWNWIKSFFSGIWNGVTRSISNGLDDVVGFFKGLPKKVMDALESLGAQLTDFGSQLLKGLWQGLNSASAWLLQKIGDFFGNLLPGWVKNILGIHSPSRVFAEIGTWLLPGLAAGMTSAGSLATVKDAVGVMHDSLVQPIDTGILYDSGTQLASSLLDGMESQYDAIRNSLAGLGSDLAKTDVNPVVSSAVSGTVGALATSSVMTTPGGNTLIYNAAENNSIPSDEDLFAAATRARMGW